MNVEKLKPWNWFKKKRDTASNVAASSNETSANGFAAQPALVQSHDDAVRSLLNLHREIDSFIDSVWRTEPLRFGGAVGRANVAFDSDPLASGFFDRFSLSRWAKADVSGGDKHYEVSIDLPGLSQDDVAVELNGNTLILSGRMSENRDTRGATYHGVIRSVGSFRHAVALPEDADNMGISASMRNGRLTVHIPKKTSPMGVAIRIPIAA